MGHEERPQLIEQSSKRSKLIRLAGVACFLIAIAVAVIGADEYGAGDNQALIAGGIAGVGVILYGIGQAVAWWNHG